MRRLPKGYRVTVKDECGMWATTVWLNGRFLYTMPLLHEFRADARQAGVNAIFVYVDRAHAQFKPIRK